MISKRSILIMSILLFINSSSFCQNNATGCSLLQHGTFKYLDIEDTTAHFKIDQTSHIEYHNSGKYKIVSQIKWLSNCQYSMTMLSNNFPNFPFNPGDIMFITITKVDGDIIYYSSEIDKKKWSGRLQKIED
jgi:hypothetical protein